MRLRVQARTSPEEMATRQRKWLEKLNAVQEQEIGQVVIPKKGFSSLSVEGGALHDPASDKAFIDALKKICNPGDQDLEVDRTSTRVNLPRP